MTITLEPETQARLEALAAQKGATPEEVAELYLKISLLTEAEREALEDEKDGAEAMRRLKNTPREAFKTLDEWRAEAGV